MVHQSHSLSIWYISHILSPYFTSVTFSRRMVHQSHSLAVWCISYILSPYSTSSTFPRHMVHQSHSLAIWYISHTALYAVHLLGPLAHPALHRYSSTSIHLCISDIPSPRSTSPGPVRPPRTPVNTLPSVPAPT